MSHNDISNQITLEVLLLALREKMIAYSQAKNYSALGNLFVTFDTLLEGFAWHRKNEESYGVDWPIYQIVEELSDHAREAASGVSWKAKLPSVDEIKAAFSDQDKFR